MLVPTAYPKVNDLLWLLLAEMRAILGDDLIGLYLDGSLALGDFDPETSDVDFMAAITRPLSPHQFAALATLHREIRDNGLALAALHGQVRVSGVPLAAEIEGSYIPLPALRRHDPADTTFAYLGRGPDEVLQFKLLHSDWVIHRYTVREHGITLFGPPPASLIDPITPDDVRRATAEVLRSWWGTAEAANHIRAAPASGLAFVALVMCRALFALEYGAVVSKPAAARWALATLDTRWQPLIEQSLAWQLDDSMKPEMIAFVRQVSGRVQLNN